MDKIELYLHVITGLDALTKHLQPESVGVDSFQSCCKPYSFHSLRFFKRSCLYQSVPVVVDVVF